MIRDAEIENIIRSLSVPVFQAAALNPEFVRIRLIQDKTLNAFVAGGQNIFIHTGLILNAEGSDALVGVIAHETGHIEGGHLVRSRDAIENAGAIQMIGTILGAAAGIATRDGAVGQAVIMGSMGAGARSFFQYSRTQESAADQAAMRLLDATGRSGKGLEKFLGSLEGQMLLSDRFRDPYLMSHPLSRERVEALVKHNQQSPYADVVTPEAEQLLFDRMVAKLYGFIEPLRSVLRRYPETDTRFAARSARAIAYYRAPELERAIAIINELIQEAPLDPYLHELKGQMLFEHARAQDAYEAYREAYRLAPKEPLIAMELARAELELNDPALLDDAIEHFRLTTQLGESSSFVWLQLSIAYARQGDIGMSSLARAESELSIGQLGNAELHATRASETLEKGSSAHLQALDILEAIKVARAQREQ
jgi:predicted Zn-dependent protease